MRSDFYELLRRLLVLHEGISLRAYKDPKGKYTIGVGHNLTDRGVPDEVARRLTCSKEQASTWLREDIDATLPLLIDRLEEQYSLNFDVLYAPAQLVLADMAFCMGVGRRGKGDGKDGVLDFERMIRRLKDHHGDGAAAELLDSQFARDTKTRAVRLATMLRTGQLPPELRRMA